MYIFIAGNSRSGTTMMSRILGNHPDVFSFQELHFFDELIPAANSDSKLEHFPSVKLYATLCSIQRKGYFGDHKPTPFMKEAEQVFGLPGKHSVIQIYKNFLINETSANGKSIPCEQTPQNIFSLEEILKSIDDSRIIVMVRDPREVLLSQKFKYKRRKLSGGKIPVWESIRSRINYHPVTISKIWHAAVQQGLRFSGDKRVMQIKYEDFLQNPVQVMREICTHVNISYSDNLLDIPIVGSSNKSDSGNKRGIDSNKTGNWDKGGLNKTEIAICENINHNLMQQLGYPLSNNKAALILLMWYYILLPFKLALALLFNLRRLKNPMKIWRRFTNSK